MKRLLEFFQDDVGALSFMRFAAFVVLAVILGVWVWGNLAEGRYVPLGVSEAGIVMAVIAGKVIQAKIEYGGPQDHG